MPEVNAYQDGVVGRLYKGLQGLVKSRNVTFVEGEGRLVGPNTVEVNGEHVHRHATSCSRPAPTPAALPGLEIGGRVITSDQALNLDYVPKSVDRARRRRHRRRVRQRLEVLRRRRHDRRGAAPPGPQRGRVACSKALERAFRKRGIDFSLGVRFAGGDAGRHRRRTSPSRTARPSRPSCCSSPSAAARSPPGWASRSRASPWTAASSLTDERLRTNVARRLRRRRHRPRPAARAPRLPAGHLRRRGDRRPQPRRHRRRRASRGSPTASPRSPRSASPRRRPRRSTATTSRSTSTTSAATARARSSATAGFVKLVREKDGPVVGVHMVGVRIGELIGEAQLDRQLGGATRRTSRRSSTRTRPRTRPSARRTWPWPASRCTPTPDPHAPRSTYEGARHRCRSPSRCPHSARASPRAPSPAG